MQRARRRVSMLTIPLSAGLTEGMKFKSPVKKRRGPTERTTRRGNGCLIRKDEAKLSNIVMAKRRRWKHARAEFDPRTAFDQESEGAPLGECSARTGPLTAGAPVLEARRARPDRPRTPSHAPDAADEWEIVHQIPRDDEPRLVRHYLSWALTWVGSCMPSTDKPLPSRPYRG